MPTSTGTPVYLPPLEMLKYYDNRRLLEVLKDDGNAALIGELVGNQNIRQAIISAEAEIDTALQNGRRYARIDLIAACTLADTGDNDALHRVAPLREMVAHLAYGKLMGRRGYGAEAMRKLAPMYEMTLQRLVDLSNGALVFDFDSNLTATVPMLATIGKQLSIRYNRLFGTFDNPYGGYGGGSFSGTDGFGW